MAPTSTTCPTCQATLRVRPEGLTRPLSCRRCRAIFRLPVAARPGWPRLAVVLVVLALAGTTAAAGWSRLTPLLFVDARRAAPPTPQASTPNYQRDVAPLVQKYCLRCHTSAKPRGGVKLDRDKDDAAVLKNRVLWERVGDNLRAGDMPPAGAARPTAAEMELLNRWLDGVVFKSDCTGPKDPGRVTIRRLNRAEYNNTIRDLVGVDFKPAKDFPADDVGYGFDNIGDVLSLPPLLMEKYLAAAETIIHEAFKKPELRRRLLPQAPSPGDRGASLTNNLRQFATRAWRRPATDDEVNRLRRFVSLAREQGDGPEVGIKLALQAVLISPHFLFRIERDPDNKDGLITQWELATRLSYFLWSSMPDEELFRLAREGKLRDPGVLEAQVRRMLRDPKADALGTNFAGQWLNTRGLAAQSFDPKRFPTYNARLRQAMVRETELYFLYVVRQDRSVLEFLDSDYTFVNADLARHYGLAGVSGDEFRRVSLAGTPRGGVLTHASVLAVTSNPTRTSLVKRGKWILENILGTPPPPPAPDAGELKEDGELKGTVRQQLEQHRANPTCASCHQRMDPLGFGFENFDAIGRWRTHEGRHPVDASGELPDGSKFNGPAELRRVLLGKKELFVKTLTEKMMTYALGRGVERADRCFVEQVAKEVAKNDYKFARLVIEIVKSDPFQKRRAKGGSK